MVFGQTLVAGSVVQGAKPCPWVKPRPARVWSEERNYGLGSSAGGGKCGPGSQTAGLGQALVAGSVVQGAKLRPRSPPSPPECGLGSKTVPLGQAQPRPSVARGEKLWSWVKR